MKLNAKMFDELTTQELYEVLKARAAVFIVEQNIVYQDMDDVDQKSLHVFLQRDDGTVAAYMRLFEKEAETGLIKLGRVLTVDRGIGLGSKLLQAGLEAAKEHWDVHTFCLDAQTHAIGFYEKEGFTVTSDEFWEEGVLHAEMRKEL